MLPLIRVGAVAKSGCAGFGKTRWGQGRRAIAGDHPQGSEADVIVRPGWFGEILVERFAQLFKRRVLALQAVQHTVGDIAQGRDVAQQKFPSRRLRLV